MKNPREKKQFQQSDNKRGGLTCTIVLIIDVIDFVFKYSTKKKGVHESTGSAKGMIACSY